MPRGGARPGAGRKKKLPPQLDVGPTNDPLEFLRGVMADRGADATLRVRAAITVAQYLHAKKGDGGKKDERQAAAERSGKGRFAASAPPKLSVVGGRKA